MMNCAQNRSDGMPKSLTMSSTPRHTYTHIHSLSPKQTHAHTNADEYETKANRTTNIEILVFDGVRSALGELVDGSIAPISA